jgi:hypothetical protein
VHPGSGLGAGAASTAVWLSPNARDEPPSDPRGVIRIARELYLKNSILRDRAIEQKRQAEDHNERGPRGCRSTRRLGARLLTAGMCPVGRPKPGGELRTGCQSGEGETRTPDRRNPCPWCRRKRR